MLNTHVVKQIFPLETSPHLSLTNFHLDFNLMCHIFRTLPTEIWIIQYHPIDHQLQIQIGHPIPLKNHPPKTTKIYINIIYIYIYNIYIILYDIYCIIDMSTIQRQSTSHSILLADKRCPRLARATVSCASSALVKGLLGMRRRRIWWWKQKTRPGRNNIGIYWI